MNHAYNQCNSPTGYNFLSFSIQHPSSLPINQKEHFNRLAFAEREPGKTRGAVVFSLNFLFLFFSRKKEKTKTIHYHKKTKPGIIKKIAHFMPPEKRAARSCLYRKHSVFTLNFLCLHPAPSGFLFFQERKKARFKKLPPWFVSHEPHSTAL
jgi:hypothetical protein